MEGLSITILKWSNSRGASCLYRCRACTIRWARGNVFEVGFGTGLNAMLAYQFAVCNATKVNYTSVERYPLPLNIVEKLTYPEQVELDREKYFNALHSAPWNSKVELDLALLCKK